VFQDAAFSEKAQHIVSPPGFSPLDVLVPASGRRQTAANAAFPAGQEARARRRNQTPEMPAAIEHIEQLERHLLQRGLGALEADRDRCADCGRTPLTGEHVHLYDGRGGEVVCELCRTLRRDAPVASEIVRHCEHGHTVRLTARAA
jgi:hypothetical protein